MTSAPDGPAFVLYDGSAQAASLVDYAASLPCSGLVIATPWPRLDVALAMRSSVGPVAVAHAHESVADANADAAARAHSIAYQGVALAHEHRRSAIPLAFPVTPGEELHALRSRAEDADAQVIVLATERRSSWSRLWRGPPLVEQLVRESRRPVVAVPVGVKRGRHHISGSLSWLERDGRLALVTVEEASRHVRALRGHAVTVHLVGAGIEAPDRDGDGRQTFADLRVGDAVTVHFDRSADEPVVAEALQAHAGRS